jgi:hypothetical protein
MKPTDLFSHPYEPEFVPNIERDSEPVQAPAFSDAPQSDTTATVDDVVHQEALTQNGVH